MTHAQRKLFDDADAPWEDDDAAQRLLATVVFAEGAPGEYDYLVPDRLAGEVQVGCRLRVPFGRQNRKCEAWCVAVGVRPDSRSHLKEVAGLIDESPLLSPPLLRVTRWISEYYLCPLGVALEAVIPAGVRQRAGTKLAILLSVPEAIKAGLGNLRLPRKQQAALDHLAASPTPLTAHELARCARCALGPIQELKKKGLILAQRRRVQPVVAAEDAVPDDQPHTLNAEQRAAADAVLAALRAPRHETFLLFGVTGSGKTEVYMQTIAETLAYGRQAIVLVPEISLTPQTLSRFRARFGSVAVLHSHLSDVERNQQWRRIASGEARVVIGARSAVFAPTPDLGLIVLDEEHESSFKQEISPRYHAREVARRRAADEGVPLLLGSATPSLETWLQAQTGEARLLRLSKRVLDRPLPGVAPIDLREDSLRNAARGALSRRLAAAVQQALDDDGQVILLLNRRGHSTHIQCPACGLTLHCPACDIALTYHRHGEFALCHYCDHEVPAPTRCPKCAFAGIRFSGLGTQRLEAEVKARYPDLAVARMDSDAMQKPGSHERVLDAFRRGEIRILLGTQMIAKGLDFPDVTLVGVINADTALQLPDFRAAERTFQLLTQVAGRTGRGDKGGRVLIQTYSPDHPAIQAALRHDFEAFAAGELPIRKVLNYPPFGHMVRAVIRGPVEDPTRAVGEALAERLKVRLAGEPSARVLGPVPCPIARIRELFRFQVQALALDGGALRAAARAATEDLPLPDRVAWIIDVDPLHML